MEEKRSLLIVDDVEMNRAILSEAFYQEYDIIEAENGRDALLEIEKNGKNIAAILLDIVMPFVDGFGVIEQMKKKNLMEVIPVFLITSDESDESLNRGYELGVVDVIRKPFKVDFIHRRLSNIIELYRHRNELETVVNEQIEKLQEQSEKLRQFNSNMIDTLSTVIEFRDCESGEHVKRIRGVTDIMLHRIAKRFPEYGLTEDQMALIADASAMHDIGKISIPDYILCKPGRLTNEEFAIMKEHTIRGCEILERVPTLKGSEIYDYCYDICRHHHERWDGRGYPDGLKGSEISIWSQCVALADVYDALVSPRVYKAPFSHEKAVEMIQNGECGAFNPELLDCFSQTADEIWHTLYDGAMGDATLIYERKTLEPQA